MPNSSAAEPVMEVVSIGITHATDTIDSKTFGHPESFSRLTWSGELLVKKDFELKYPYNLDAWSHPFGYIQDDDKLFFIRRLAKKEFKTGDKISLTNMHTLLIGNETGGHWVCYTLFDFGAKIFFIP